MKPQLAIYLPSLSGGGIERMQLHLAPAFIAAGYEVTLVLHTREGELYPQMPRGVRIEILGHRGTLACLLPLVRFLKRARPDIMLSNLGHNNIVALWAVALARTKTRVVATFHRGLSAECNVNASWRYRALPFLCRWFLRFADAVVTVSHGMADDLAQLAKFPRERIQVIYNPVVFDGFDSRIREAVDHPWLAEGAAPYLLAVGRLVEQKDYPTMLRAFARVVQARDVHLIVLGEGPLRESLQALAHTLGISDRVSLPGFVPNPLPYMRRAKALLLSSAYEGFGNVLAEALACGTNVVSTDCPYGPAEILEEGRFGSLVAVGDVIGFAAGILDALAAPMPAEFLRARGREFTVSRSLRDYLALFQSMERTPITLKAIKPVA